MLGGTTSLYEKSGYYEGDMSGISATNDAPLDEFTASTSRNRKFSKTKSWEARIRLIVRNARNGTSEPSAVYRPGCRSCWSALSLTME
jgi:hypothetical protein